jgi:polysaccharide export outer membrane protein
MLRLGMARHDSRTGILRDHAPDPARMPFTGRLVGAARVRMFICATLPACTPVPRALRHWFDVGFLLAFKAIQVASSGGSVVMTTPGPVFLVGRLLHGARPWCLAGIVAGTAFALGAPVSAQGQAPAPGAERASSGSTDIQVVPSGPSSPTRIEPVEEEYRIGTQDLLEVQVLGIQDLRREARVNAKGLIGLPLIGAVHVAGLTSAEAEALISGLYSKDYLQNPEVSVFVKEYTRQYVTIDGAVGKPGSYPLKGPTTLLQALAGAGGQGSLTDLTDVVLFRMDAGERRAIKFDVAQIRAAEAPDPLLQPGDLVVVNRSAARVAIRDSLLGDIIGIFNPFNYVTRP